MSVKTIGKYQIIGSLGSGSSAKVKLAIDKETQKKYAIKVLKRSYLLSEEKIYDKIRREIALMSLLDHPYILKLYDVFECTCHLYIVLEYAEGGELYDQLVDFEFDEFMSMKIFRQIIYSIEYMNVLGICHRDLKPENILLDEFENIKIADFGFALWMKKGIAETSCGSPHYIAPEVIKAQPYSGLQADLWSAGVILYTMIEV